MQVILLVNGEDVLSRACDAARPEGVTYRQGKYGNEGLHVVTYETEGSAVESAGRLAELRDSVLCSDAKILRDDPSELFCQRLYPRVMRFERDLRMALIVVLCASEGNFNDKRASSLETQSLGGLDNTLFLDKRLKEKLQEFIGGKKGAVVSKLRVAEAVQNHDEATTWDHLFGDDLAFIKRSFPLIRDFRNDIMHFHTMGYQRYRQALRVFRRANTELDDYLQDSLNDVQYPSAKAADAKEAVNTLTDTYASIAQTFATTMDAAEALQRSALANVDMSWLRNIQDGLAAYKDIAGQVADGPKIALTSIDMSQYADLIESQRAMADALRPFADALESVTPQNASGHDDEPGPNDGGDAQDDGASSTVADSGVSRRGGNG